MSQPPLEPVPGDCRAGAHPAPAQTSSPLARDIGPDEPAPVWDRFIRLFHWSLVIAIATAATTGFLADATWINVHVWSAVVAVTLVALRIIWGFAGPADARFSGFVRGPRAVIAHLRELRAGNAPRHIGHNPLGAVMVVALLAAIALLAVTGALVLGGQLKSGPLAFATSFALGRSAREVHELVAFALAGLVALHLGGVIVESLRTRENLARAMVDGRKERRPGDHAVAARTSRPFVAAALGVLLLGSAGYGVSAFAGRPALGVPDIAMDPVYTAECTACHMGYHPSLLPRVAWAGLMATLDDHFGEDASLPAATAATIAAWLDRNAAESSDTKAANRLRITSPDHPFTITATPFWRRTHRDVPERLFEHKKVGASSNCAGCHTDAATGRFHPARIRLPEETSS